eukprot:1520319-Pleurochrysis_carterae.AAC.2
MVMRPGRVYREAPRMGIAPPERLKGRTRRSPLDVGGEMMAFTSANRHSVEDDSQSALTDSNESLKLGAQRTFLSVTWTTCPDSFMAQTRRSPIAVQRWGRPSMPATRSWHARTFTRSDK